MILKFRKVRNEKAWIAQNGTRIDYNPFFKNYTINKGTWFKFADTLEKAKEIAQTNYMFNR